MSPDLAPSDFSEQLLRLRFQQLIVNEYYKQKKFKVPVHLALGHEAIAIAVAAMMVDGDQLVLPHRNIHYHLARKTPLSAILAEYCLQPSGAAQGNLGSMNLSQPSHGLPYTSSILGNNFGIATGLALAKSMRQELHLVTVITGDGAIEEGAFYETLVFLKSHGLKVLIVVENNDCSLATRISERRCPIDLKQLCGAIQIPYRVLDNNHVGQYVEQMQQFRAAIVTHSTPLCVEVTLSTLGDYSLITDEYPLGKWINYHAGPAPKVDLTPSPILNTDHSDPVFVWAQEVGMDRIQILSSQVLYQLQEFHELSLLSQ